MDLHEIWYLSILRKYVKKIHVSLISDKKGERVDPTLHEDQYTFVIIYRWNSS